MNVHESMEAALKHLARKTLELNLATETLNPFVQFMRQKDYEHARVIVSMARFEENAYWERELTQLMKGP